MNKNSIKKQLAQDLPDRIRFLSRKIARKPSSFRSRWAVSIDQSFDLYTNTSTVNLIQSINNMLAEENWPLPAYLNAKGEIYRLSPLPGLINSLKSFIGLSRLVLILMSLNVGLNKKKTFDAHMSNFSRFYAKDIFSDLKLNPLLKEKRLIINEIEKAYRLRMWATCITTMVPIFDFVMRSYFGSQDLKISIQTLRDAFGKSGLKPKDLKPGHAIWEARENPHKGNTFTKSIEEDLRLPGVYLSSFFEFADRYYGWYESTDNPDALLNRHAIIHCSTGCWNEPNAIRLLTFLDLTLKLENVLKTLIHGDTFVDT